MEKTALAEAEVEYHDHTSTTIWVRFPVMRAPVPAPAGAAVVIWTTTPWTMPGNRAIAAGAEIDYALVRVDGVAEAAAPRAGDRLLVALALLPQFLHRPAIADAPRRCACCKGADLAGTICRHPLRGRGYDFDVPVLLGDFVTTEAGTGFVHIAPGHGEDDFVLGRAHGAGGAGHRRRRRHLQCLGAAVRRAARLQGGRPGLRRADRRRRRCWRAASWCIPIRIPGAPRRR